MKIKKLSKICYEIETKHNLIYITKEKNLNTKNLYIYFIDIFSNNESRIYNGYKEKLSEVFDDLYLAIEYLENNFNIPKNITKKIK